jgi:hypothetical protein
MIKESSMTPPKAHSTSITKYKDAKDTEMTTKVEDKI